MSIIRDVSLTAENYLKNNEILLFIGPRQAGKTTILRQLQSYLKKNNENVYFLNLEDPDYLDLLNKSPKNLFKIFTIDLNKRTFVLVDEAQYLKNPSNFLKYFYDEYGGKIKILVSGSSVFYIDKKFKDSLAGRKKIFYVRTLSLQEFLRFKNEEELARIVSEKKEPALQEKEKINFYFREYLTYGGYPRVVLAPIEEKADTLREIAYSYIKKDIYEANVRQDEIFYKLLKILAGQIGNLVNASELALTLGVSKTTIDNYLYIMRKSFHIHLISPFHKNIRKELTKMPKVYFADLGLRNFFTDNFKSFEVREDKGVLLENGFFRQLLEEYDEDNIKFWRTIQKNEIDFVVTEKKAYEVKVNPEQFKKSNYQVFSENYPTIDFSIVTLDARASVNSQGIKILEIW